MPSSAESWADEYLQRFYYSRPGWLDGTSEFHKLCSSMCSPNARILEIGAGPSNDTSRFLATLGELHGLDPDPEVGSNDALQSASILSGENFPFPSAMFDMCVSNYVCEHVSDPEQHLKEVYRVLKPGAAYVFRTPNRFHYVALVSSMTPHWFHKLVANRLRNRPKAAHDPYPTFYRMNSKRELLSLARKTGFSTAKLLLIEKEPSYGQSSRVLFVVFLAYERVVNGVAWLSGLRSNIFGVLQRT